MKRRVLGRGLSGSIVLTFLVLGMVGPACYGTSDGIVPAIGVLGDSYSDEYQFYPPDRSTAQNWVEILARRAA